MKKCLLLFLFLGTLYAQAQDQYIEVVVTDTMTVEPKEWNYFLFLQTNLETEATAPIAGRKTLPQKIEAAEKTIDSIRAIAVAAGGEITGDRNTPLNFTMTPKSYYGGREPQYLSIRFTSRQAIEAFIRATNKRGDIEGRITATLHPDMPPFTDKLTARMVETAKAKAAKLATQAGRKLGAVILVSEVADPEKNMYQGLFERMMESDRSSWLPGWHSQSAEQPTDKIKLEKTLRLRFALL